MTETDAAELLKPRDAQYIEFFGTVQDIMLGCDNTSQAVEMLQQLIKAYQE